jgi:hypothetical protein
MNDDHAEDNTFDEWDISEQEEMEQFTWGAYTNDDYEDEEEIQEGGYPDEYDCYDEKIDQDDICSHCGKDRYDFSDLGCGYCDRRHPEWGMFP